MSLCCLQVGWLCVAVELCFGGSMVVAKGYLDIYGPYSARGQAKLRLTSDQQFGHVSAPAARNWLTTAAGLPGLFPLLTHSPAHQAQHLLLDCRLALPGAPSSPRGGSGGGSRSGSRAVPPSTGRLLLDVAALLEGALAEAGLPVGQRQLQKFPSFSVAKPQQAPQQQAPRQRQQQQNGSTAFSSRAGAPAGGGVTAKAAAPGAQAAAADGGTTAKAAPAAADVEAPVASSAAHDHPDMLFLACRDSYATLMWYSATATLAVDLVAASPEAIDRMNQVGAWARWWVVDACTRWLVETAHSCWAH